MWQSEEELIRLLIRDFSTSPASKVPWKHRQRSWIPSIWYLNLSILLQTIICRDFFQSPDASNPAICYKTLSPFVHKNNVQANFDFLYWLRNFSIITADCELYMLTSCPVNFRYGNLGLCIICSTHTCKTLSNRDSYWVGEILIWLNLWYWHCGRSHEHSL